MSSAVRSRVGASANFDLMASILGVSRSELVEQAARGIVNQPMEVDEQKSATLTVALAMVRRQQPI